MISRGTSFIWAKSGDYRQPASIIAPTGHNLYLPLHLHLRDAGAIGYFIARNWVAPSVKNLLKMEFPDLNEAEREEEFSTLASFLSAVHDIGKATPSFSGRNKRLHDRLIMMGFPAKESMSLNENIHHTVYGQAIFEQWAREYDVSEFQASILGSVISAHHGIPAFSRETVQVRTLVRNSEIDKWKISQKELIDEVIRFFDFEEHINKWLNKKWSQPFLVLISAVTIVADWLASSEDLFPLLKITDDGLEFSVRDTHKQRVETALKQLGFPQVWKAQDLGLSPNQILQSRFSLPLGATCTNGQLETVATARNMDLPGLLIIQESTGSGKTEAALMAAEILAARMGKSGVIFALPTQATTDAMFTRQISWLENIEKAYQKEGSPGTYSVQLMHGRQKYNEQAAELRKVGNKIKEQSLGFLSSEHGDYQKVFPNEINADAFSSIGKDESQQLRDIAILQWFRGRKKAILSDFVTSTVDHILFTAMASPHLALRHLGLSRKVVIIDEVHSYSTYMNHYLDKAITWLSFYGVPVILLSATLSEKRSSELMWAYKKGQMYANGQKPLRSSDLDVIQTSFPTIIASSKDSVKVVPVDSSREIKRVYFDEAPQENLKTFLEDKLQTGGCVLIVRNTVKRAQQTYQELKEYFPDITSLHHARFTLFDRSKKDQELLRKFGHPSKVNSRPHKAIVVATQVVEQSLDVDFDLLITDLAPIDLILQRVGRLHRHKRVRPSRLKTPLCLIDELPSVLDTDPKIEPGAASIYGMRDLLMTAQVVHNIFQSKGYVEDPNDIHDLIESVYGESAIINSAWRDALEAAQARLDHEITEKEKSAKAFLLSDPPARGKTAHLNNWLDSTANDSENKGRARVRDGQDSIEVLLINKIQVGAQEELRVLDSSPICGGALVSPNEIPSRELGRAIVLSSVRLPAKLSSYYMISDTLSQLESEGYFPAWQKNSDLAGQLILQLQDGKAVINGVELVYDSNVGLLEVKD